MLDPKELYLVQLTPEEQMNPRTLAVHPGFPALVKLIHGEATRAGARAIASREPNEKRIQLLDWATVSAEVTGNLIKQLQTYCSLIPTPPDAEVEAVAEELGIDIPMYGNTPVGAKT
jgi:hypothetical protein